MGVGRHHGGLLWIRHYYESQPFSPGSRGRKRLGHGVERRRRERVGQTEKVAWKHLHCACACVHAKSLQACSTLCSPKDCSPRGSSIYGILQARILEWLPCAPPGDLPDPRMEPASPALQADSLPSESLGKPKHVHYHV